MEGNKKEVSKFFSFEFILQILGAISSVNIKQGLKRSFHNVKSQFQSSCHPSAVAEDAPIKIMNETEIPKEMLSAQSTTDGKKQGRSRLKILQIVKILPSLFAGRMKT